MKTRTTHNIEVQDKPIKTKSQR